MRGLFLKDYYLFIKKCRSIMIIMLLAVIIPLTATDSPMLTFYPSLIVSMVPMTLLAYDEKDGWNRYSAAMPFSKKDIVVEKYLFGLMLSALVIVLTIISGIIVNTLKNQLDISYYIYFSTMLVSICFIAPSVMLPFVFRYGVEKGRIFYYIVIGCSYGIIFALSSLGGSVSTFERLGNILGFVVPAVSVLIYMLSIMLSIKLFEKSKAD